MANLYSNVTTKPLNPASFSWRGVFNCCYGAGRNTEMLSANPDDKAWMPITPSDPAKTKVVSNGGNELQHQDMVDEDGTSTVCDEVHKDDRAAIMFSDSDSEMLSSKMKKHYGMMRIHVRFDKKRAIISVKLLQLQGVPGEMDGKPCVYQVRLTVLPGNKVKLESDMVPGPNPNFDNILTIEKILPSEFPTSAMRFRLYNCERKRREKLLGESIIAFTSFDTKQPGDYRIIFEAKAAIKKKTPSSVDMVDHASGIGSSCVSMQSSLLGTGTQPEMLIGLGYNPTTGRLAVEIVKGSSLVIPHSNNKPPDCFVKVRLVEPTGQEIATTKTTVRRGQPNPLFREKFMFQVPLFQLTDITLMFHAYHRRTITKKDSLGWFAIGASSSGEEETDHWKDMKDAKGEIVCRWHTLLEKN